MIPNADATESIEPTDHTLDHPSYPSEAASMILSATSDDRLDALCSQGVTGRLAVVSAICEEDIRMTAWPASLARGEGEAGHCRQAVEFKWHVLRSASDHECVPEDFDHRAVRNLRSAALRPHGLLYTRQSLQLRKERVRHRAPAILAPSMDHEDNEVAVRK